MDTFSSVCVSTPNNELNPCSNDNTPDIPKMSMATIKDQKKLFFSIPEWMFFRNLFFASFDPN